MTSRELVRAARVRVVNAGAIVRRIIGAPDYDRYVAHLRDHHPGATPMTYDEFARQQMADRYSRPGTRCC
jgi:uncharacterized short protein YbdD (DUF466 family)